MTVNPAAQNMPTQGDEDPLNPEPSYVRSMAYLHGPDSLMIPGHHPQMQDRNLGYGIPTSIYPGMKRSAGSAGMGMMEPPSSDEDQDQKPHIHPNFDEFQAGAGRGKPIESSQPSGKKTKGRVKIKMEFIDNKLRRYTTFSKRKTGIMKKAYELSTLTGTQVMLLVASETGHVYTFATRKLQPMITSDAGKALIQTCLNSPDPPPTLPQSGEQRMSATGYEETELTYNVNEDEQQKVRQMMYSSHYGGPSHSLPSHSFSSPSSSNQYAAASHSPYMIPNSAPSPSPSHHHLYSGLSLSSHSPTHHIPSPEPSFSSHHAHSPSPHIPSPEPPYSSHHAQHHPGRS